RPLAFGIIVMNKRHESCAASCRGPFQHLLVAVGVAESKNRTTTNERFNPNRLALFVVDELHSGQSQEEGLPIADFIFHFAAAADDLLRWNAVTVFGETAHELDAAAGNDERFESVRAHVPE